MNATVTWDEATRTVTSIKVDINIVMKIGNNVMSKNGSNINLDVPAQILNGGTLVPALSNKRRVLHSYFKK